MAAKWFVLPVLIHVALVLFLALKLAAKRRDAVITGEVNLRDIAVDTSRWPGHLQLYANAYNNQFQLPLMFYAVVIFHIMLAATTPLACSLAWLFVIARYVHAYIHVTSNNVVQRLYAFAAGLVAVMAMWVHLAVKLFLN